MGVRTAALSLLRWAQVGWIAGAFLPLLVGVGALSMLPYDASAAEGSTAPAPLWSVRVGGRELAAAEVMHAQTSCATHMAELTLKQCLDRFFVPRWLLDRWVVDERRDHAPGWLMQRDDLLHLALVTQLERAAPAPSEQEIERYVAEHPRDYQKPLRIRIFRLLVKQEDKANELLAQLGGPVDLLRFRALCRDHSIDKATHERGGDLGFVWPDGSTDVPEVSADPALYAAALPLKEGQLAPQVVKEGEHFALVWRRGSLPKETTGEAARARIAALLRERAVEQQISALLDQLKKDAVRDRADVLLGRLRRKDTRLFIEP